MNKNKDLRELGGGFLSMDQNVRTFQPPKHATSVNGRKIDDDFGDFAEPKKAPEQAKPQEQQKAPQEPAKQEGTQAPASQEVAKTEPPKEAPAPAQEQAEKPKTSKKGRSGRKARNTEELHYSAEMAPKKHLLHESRIMSLTYKSMNEEVLLNLMTQQILMAHEIYEDTAPAILNHLWKNSLVVKDKRVYLDTLQQTATELGASYSNVQKVVKKLINTELLEKTTQFLIFSELLTDFYTSLTDNKQIVINFEKLQEEQMEAIDKEGHVNEAMTN